MGLLDFFRAAIQPTAAAAVGFQTGQDQERDKQRQEKRTDAIDAMNRQMHQSTIDDNKARAGWYTARGNAADEGTWSNPLPSTDPVTKQPVMVQVHKQTGEIRLARIGPLATIQNAVGGGVSGGMTTDTTSLPGDSQDMTGGDSPLQTITKAAQQPDPLQPYVKPVAPRAPGAPPRIDPNSPEGIEAARQKAANNARLRQQYPAAARAGSANNATSQARLNAQAAVNEARKNLPHPSKIDKEIPNPQRLNVPKGVDPKTIKSTIANPAYTQAIADSTRYQHDILDPAQANLMRATGNANIPLGKPTADESTLSDADLWEKKVAEGLSKNQATAYVSARKKPPTDDDE